MVSVRQARGLPVVSLFPHPASFRFHLAMDTLAFGYILPTTGRIRDFHPLETCAAGRTHKGAGHDGRLLCINLKYYPKFLRFALISSLLVKLLSGLTCKPYALFFLPRVPAASITRITARTTMAAAKISWK